MIRRLKRRNSVRFIVVLLALLLLTPMPTIVSSFSTTKRNQLSSRHLHLYLYSTKPDNSNTLDDDIEGLQRLVTAASLSYLPLPAKGNDEENNNQETKKTMIESPYYNEEQLLPLKQVIDPISKAGATIFKNQDDGRPSTIVVACRGSANWDNFITNLKFQLVPVENELILYEDHDTNNQQYTVHTGFQTASINLWKVLQPALNEILLLERSTSQGPIELVFTGHSLGSATALLCAVQYTLQQQTIIIVIIINNNAYSILNHNIWRTTIS